MRSRTRYCVLMTVLAVLAPIAVSAETLFALIAPRSLVRFDSAAPGAILGGALITGLAGASGEVLVGIDFRPATRELFAFSVDSAGAGRAYRIDPVTGVATLIGTSLMPSPLQHRAVRDGLQSGRGPDPAGKLRQREPPDHPVHRAVWRATTPTSPSRLPPPAP